MPARFGQALAWAWLGVFYLLAFTASTVHPPHPLALPLLALGGFAMAWSNRETLAPLLREHRGIAAALPAFVAAIALAELLAQQRGVEGLAPYLPPSIWLVACLPGLVAALGDEARLRASVILFAALCVWHWFTMPYEAVTGVRLSWQPVALFPREAGPLNFQASGLAWQVYYFTGLFLPLFYLAWGPWAERSVKGPRLAPMQWVLLAMAWGLPAVCAQSRSAFAGTLAAGLLALVTWRRPKRASAWAVLGLLLVTGGVAYYYLFSANKSGMDLRLAYYQLYLAEALKWPAVVTGHGFTLVPNAAMFAKGYTPLEHSHNDLIQTIYSWGFVAAGAYLLFWAALLRDLWRHFLAHGRVWPVCALLVFLPTTATDLGFQHFEKAAFIVIFTAWCIVFARRPAPVTSSNNLPDPVPPPRAY